MFALVNGAGGVHRVRVGDYLGRNNGRIIAINEGKIDVVEIVPDGEGGWLERPRSLSQRALLKGGVEDEKQLPVGTTEPEYEKLAVAHLHICFGRGYLANLVGC